MIESQVYTDYGTTWGNSRLRNGNGDVESPFAFAVDQISTACSVANVLVCIRWDSKWKFYSSCDSSKATGGIFPLDPVGPDIVTDRTEFDVGTLDRLEHRNGLALLQRLSHFLRIVLFVLFLPRQCRLHGFGCLDTSGTDQLSRQVRIGSTQGIISLLMQFYPVATLLCKASLHYLIEAHSMLTNGTVEYPRLLRSSLYVQDKCSIHVKRISYITRYCQAVGLNRLSPAPSKEDFLLPPMNERGFRKSSFL